MGVQGPGPLGTALFHSAAPVQQRAASPEDKARKSLWRLAMKMGGTLGLRHGSQAEVWMPAGVSPYPCGEEGFEPEPLIHRRPILTLQIPFLYLLCLSLWIFPFCHCHLDSEKHFRHSFIEAVRAVCMSLLSLIEKVEVVAEFRNITKEHGPVAFVLHEGSQCLKASPVPQEAGTTFSSSSSASPGCQARGLFLGITQCH